MKTAFDRRSKEVEIKRQVYVQNVSFSKCYPLGYYYDIDNIHMICFVSYRKIYFGII